MIKRKNYTCVHEEFFEMGFGFEILSKIHDKLEGKFNLSDDFREDVLWPDLDDVLYGVEKGLKTMNITYYSNDCDYKILK